MKINKSLLLSILFCIVLQDAVKGKISPYKNNNGSVQAKPTSKLKRQYIQQSSKPVVETLTVPPTRRNYKTDAASIVGDVNKYGLWEYTSDNTEMGDQIKQLMSKANSIDIAGETAAHALEKEAFMKNEQINKYAEALQETAPSIDPMEQPIEMDGSQKSLDNASPNEQKFYNRGGESVSVVSIPSSLTIEDEHGHHLDIVNASSTTSENDKLHDASLVQSSESSKHHDTQFEKSVASTLELLRSNSSLSTKKEYKSTENEESLTVRLLNAMKKSDAFRKKAEELLPTSSDSDMKLFQKERQLYNNLRMIEKQEPKESTSTGELKLHIPQYAKKTENNLGNDGKLLTSIKQLIHDDYSSHNEEQTVLKDLLKTMKKVEGEEGKIETNFADGGGGNGAGETLSDTYLNHFKEFLEKHKQKEHGTEHAETNSAVDDNPKLSGNAMPNFLQKEASSFNKFHDLKANPKVELQRLEAMLHKQERKEEPLENKNEKLLQKQLSQLIKDKAESQNALNKIKSHNGDNKDKVLGKPTEESTRYNDGITDQEIKLFDDSILKYIQHSKRFQHYLQENGVLQAGSITPTSRSNGDGIDRSDRPLADQFEEIELQKDILNLKERQLRNRDRNRALQTKKEKEREKQFFIAKSNHMLHLTNPEREKLSEDSKNSSEDEDPVKFKSKNKDEKHDTEKESKGREYLKLLEIEDKEKESGKVTEKEIKDDLAKSSGKAEKGSKPGKKEENDNLLKSSEKEEKETPVKAAEKEEKETSSPSQKVNSEKSESEASLVLSENQNKSTKNEEDTTVQALAQKLNERLATLSVSEQNLLAQDLNSLSENDGITKKTTQGFDKVLSKSLTADRQKMLNLPINNPKPDAEASLTPHAHFHSPSSSAISKPRHVTGTSRHFSPSSKSFRTVRPERRQFTYHPTELQIKSPSQQISTSKTKNAVPSISNRTLHQTPRHASLHHIYPILEPPPATTTSHKNAEDSSDRKFIQLNKILQPEELPDHRSSNLLRHKIISSPNVIDKKQIKMFVHPVGDKLIRFIEPKSYRTIDKNPVKKGFGKLPVKPKAYLLSELQRDVNLLEKRSKQMKHTLSKKNSMSTNFHRIFVPSKRKEIEAKQNIAIDKQRSAVRVEDVFNILQSEDQKELPKKA